MSSNTLPVEVRGVTRASFILRGALAAGSVYGLSAVAPFVTQALAETGGGDAEILNFALTLEYLESDFYNVKGKQVGLSGQARSYAKMFGEEEQAHVNALSTVVKQLGATPVAKPTFVFPVTSEHSFLELASVLENTGVGAYNGAAPSLKSKQVLEAAGSIVQIEARHAAAIDLLIEKSPTPSGGFDVPLTKAQVLAKAGPLIKA
jgi:Ferritin-like domain